MSSRGERERRADTSTAATPQGVSKMELKDFPGTPEVLYIRDEKTRAKIGVKIKGVFPELVKKASN